MNCEKCGTELPAGARFCASCGGQVGPVAPPTPSPALSAAEAGPGPGAGALAPAWAAKGTRAAGYLIDLLPAFLLVLFALIPFVGSVIAGLLLTPYWLFRDVAGASPGKLLLGTKIVGPGGQPTPTSARIIRNVPLAIGPFLLIIPLLGYVLAPVAGGIVILVETILIITQGERLGDKLAGTRVVKK